MTRTTLLVFLASCACSGTPKQPNHVEPPADATPATADAPTSAANDTKPMPTPAELQAIRNDNIQFVTYTYPDDYGQIPPEMFRQVGISAPPEAVALTESGDPRAFDVLLPMLDDPDRNWAAYVILVALTGTQAETVTMFDHTNNFQGSSFQINARKEWGDWLAKNRAQLHWNPKRKQFRLHGST